MSPLAFWTVAKEERVLRLDLLLGWRFSFMRFAPGLEPFDHLLVFHNLAVFGFSESLADFLELPFFAKGFAFRASLMLTEGDGELGQLAFFVDGVSACFWTVAKKNACCAWVAQTGTLLIHVMLGLRHL